MYEQVVVDQEDGVALSAWLNRELKGRILVQVLQYEHRMKAGKLEWCATVLLFSV